MKMVSAMLPSSGRARVLEIPSSPFWAAYETVCPFTVVGSSDSGVVLTPPSAMCSPSLSGVTDL